jgi:hypothetical protein
MDWVSPYQLLSIITLIGLVIADSWMTRRAGGAAKAQAAGGIALTLSILVAIVVDDPIGYSFAGAVFAGLTVVRPKWIAVIGGWRPTVGVYLAYREIFRNAELQWTTDDPAVRSEARETVHAELRDLERWRTAKTSRLIDLLRKYYRLRSEDQESRDVLRELDEEMQRVWGPANGQGVR